ncbi:MAG: hypothetical protein QUS11_07250 [Candidatus Fermentibacter sp.]|nr:hypothetical protein [Candidatus Fermentibacter sp.]
MPYGVFHRSRSVNGPDDTLLLWIYGRTFLCSPPDWIPEPLELEIPYSREQSSLYSVYDDDLDCLFVLIGNGLFRFPWGSLEADSILLLGRPFSNRDYSWGLIQGGDRSILLAGVGESLFLLDAGRMEVLDSLDLSFTASNLIWCRSSSAAYVKDLHSDSIRVVSVPDGNLELIHILRAGVSLDHLGFAGDTLLGGKGGTLYYLDPLNGQASILWDAPSGDRQAYEWVFPYQWGHYAYRVDWEAEQLNLIDISSMSIVGSSSITLLKCFDLLIQFTSRQDGFIYHSPAGGLFRLVPSGR